MKLTWCRLGSLVLLGSLSLVVVACGTPDHEQALQTAKELRRSADNLSDTDALKALQASDDLLERLAAIKIEAQQNRLLVLERMAERQLEAGLLPDALNTVNKLIELQPARVNWHRMKGRILTQWGQVDSDRYAGAQEAFDRALGIDPQDLRTHYLYGLLLGFHLDKPDRARRELNRVAFSATITPQNRNLVKDARFALGKLEHQLGNFGGAREAFLSVTDMNGIPQGDRFLAYRNLGDVYRAMGSRERAIEAYRNAYDVNPRDSGIRERLRNLDVEVSDRYSRFENR